MPPDRPPSKTIKQATKLYQDVSAFRCQHSILVSELTDLRDRLAKCRNRNRPISLTPESPTTPDSSDRESIRTSIFSTATCDTPISLTSSRVSITPRVSKRWSKKPNMTIGSDKFDWEIPTA